MTSQKLRPIYTVVAQLICLVFIQGIAQAQLRAGASVVKITPQAGVPMAGYYFTRLADGVHDDLFAKALVLESGGTKVALVTLDLISTTRDITEAARRETERITGIPGRNVMISATHAHTGPLLANRGGRDDALGSSAESVRKYSDELAHKIAQAVEIANSRLAPAKLSAGKGRDEHLSFNRRFYMKDGTVGWNPGKLNPNIVKPAGPIDPEVGALFVESAANTPVAAYVNFAMHLDTVGGTRISADYPYTLSRLLSEAKTPDMVTLFANGCCGNINHIDVGWTDKQHGNDEAARIGTILTADVLQICRQLMPVDSGPLRISSEMVKLPLPALASGDVEKARVSAGRVGTKSEPKFLEIVNAFKVLDVAERNGRPQEVEVQVIALGDDVAWVSLPGEIFVELGLAIKKASPFKYTYIAELANGSIGYIPDSRAYPQGNYEVISARCARGSGEMLVKSAARMLRELKGKNQSAARGSGDNMRDSSSAGAPSKIKSGAK